MFDGLVLRPQGISSVRLDKGKSPSRCCPVSSRPNGALATAPLKWETVCTQVPEPARLCPPCVRVTLTAWSFWPDVCISGCDDVRRRDCSGISERCGIVMGRARARRGGRRPQARRLPKEGGRALTAARHNRVSGACFLHKRPHRATVAQEDERVSVHVRV